ncbi:ATP-binding cassette domain-containing protein [Candidatus Falkowbacteria bacterium]|uniref:Cell division ATP-binding protein FtsE n=1 Tax=Candidatus Falkowbacteria bacterium CG10_big_fil_rev_8_21_14_0_10_37_18 TaxID=1974562 RepID=A0A2H0V9Q0_9BACT|nr:ATP-binding cassette domain-containing protein [Candidatus Falkowbacteria bacterium]NCQ12851.1 ATP-binding cassette domain-containing protein [Candidatus Falkowbacteria bacterium]OIO05437.1 MAG: cell division ATP-binding protein FtsE [Candidatus Falkowbacteria bacterium CG1_02_37_21]PIQ80135.1 MAG: cell division ATP-binding protein FtsE [Parcubacteria group bacterium CG11_big_fil_rev_8_21_14_0_20_41_14]PIR95791.1 MAG: cell division ATP-binding protein FtsE [Candidatus Falkowbacteria bacteriu
MIHLENISKSYDHKNNVVNDVSLAVEPGEFVSIVGQSGAGKTTIVRLLIGEEHPDSGRLLIGDWDITRISRREVSYLRRQIGVIFQDFKLLPKKTLEENIAFALQVCGGKPAKIKKIVPSVLKIVGLEDKGKRYPHEVSGGEQQRAAIARALVHQPKVLLADEPTGNLDAINADDIINLLLRINRFGTTVILVTHNKEIVNRLNKRVVTMDHGVVISDLAHGKYLL